MQRVALARALAAEPALLLLDEPLSAVDVPLVPQLRTLLRRLLADRLAVVVTHQVLDALVLADRVVVLDGGRIAEQGPTMAVLTRPRSEFAAEVAGLNLIRGTALAGGLRTPDGIEICYAATAADAGPVPGEPVVAVFSPTDVAVHLRPPQGSPRDVRPGTICGLKPQGTLVRVRAENGIAADVTAASVADLALHPGQRVWFVVKATEVTVHALPDHGHDTPSDHRSEQAHPATSGSPTAD
ncbi:MAG: TOBE domain-containing protein [Actinobacteria bacterium]|nr:TOBE domain-containing protein [Actinomycetota bacterium]